jgi:Carboxypeptidase regulatory-like domain
VVSLLSSTRKGISPAQVFPDGPSRLHVPRSVTVLLVLCVLAASAVSAMGKKRKAVSRTVTGVVLDGAQNPIAGASVELTDTVTGKKLDIYSGEGGHYQFADLIPTHDYEVQAHQKDLASDVRKVSSLDDRDEIVINLRIPAPKE